VWNYTAFLNLVFLAVFVLLYLLYRNRRRLGAGAGQARDPVCGMQVEIAGAPAWCMHEGRRVSFCFDRCRQRFEADHADGHRPAAAPVSGTV
jgi:YHS domain-containing protein